MTPKSRFSVQRSFKNFSCVSSTKLKRIVRSKPCFWQMDKAKVTCSDGQGSFLELFLGVIFFFFKNLLRTKEYIPLCQGGLRSSLFKGAPQGRLIFPQMAMIISDSPKVNPFFQKGTRSWCKCRLEPIMPLCSLRWLNYGGLCFPRTLPKHWEACALPSREQDGWQQSLTNRRNTREQHGHRKQDAQYIQVASSEGRDWRAHPGTLSRELLVSKKAGGSEGSVGCLVHSLASEWQGSVFFGLCIWVPWNVKCWDLAQVEPVNHYVVLGETLLSTPLRVCKLGALRPERGTRLRGGPLTKQLL